jgi:hypothetical protein
MITPPTGKLGVCAGKQSGHSLRAAQPHRSYKINSRALVHVGCESGFCIPPVSRSTGKLKSFRRDVWKYARSAGLMR